MNFERLFDIIPYQLHKYEKEVALAHKVGKEWKKYSTKEVQKLADEVSKGLLQLGVKKGDKIALITQNNRPEWNFVDLGILQIGAVTVPVYPTISEAGFQFVFNHAEIKICFVDNQELYDKVLNISEHTPLLEVLYTLDEVHGANYWKNLFRYNNSVNNNQLEAVKKKVKPKDLATIIYTSGTTGTPKGVMLSHYNIVSNIKALMPILPLSSTDRAFSFLPLCHIFERTVTYTYMAFGASIYYANSMDGIMDDMQEVRPQYFSIVPRLLEMIFNKIQMRAGELDSLSKWAHDWALRLGDQYELDAPQDFKYRFQLRWARRLVFNKWKRVFGGKLKGIVVGGAALQPRLARLFNAAGIVVREGYGLTETAPVLAFNRFEPGGGMLGTVGLPIPGVEIRLSEPDNEIVVRGPNIMMGYYKCPDLTAEVLMEDGWFHTGDIGTFVRGQFLKITDRKKELFKTSNGKYVAPQPLENKFREHFLIEQIMVVGANEAYPTALIVPFFAGLKAYCEEHKIPYESFEEMIEHPQVLVKFQEIVANCNQHFDKSQQIEDFTLLPTVWRMENDELTPTLKLKRKTIAEHYQQAIEQMYQNV